MARKLDEQNRRADKVNPLRSGMRTGNPQLRARQGTTGDEPKKPKARRRRKSSKVRRGG